MTLDRVDLLADFLPALLAGMVVNFDIATMALVAGLALGVPLAIAASAHPIVRVTAAVAVGMMRAAPTFVVMFFLLSVLPRDTQLPGLRVAVSGQLVVALALVPYAAAYVADNVIEALVQWRKGSRFAALLLLPNVARAYFVLVMASSAGAAVGVTEGISIILRQAEHLPMLTDKLVLFGIGILLFGIPMQLAFFALDRLRARLAGYVYRQSRP